MSLCYGSPHGSYSHLKQSSPEDSHSHHPHPHTFAIVIALITMSNSILRMPSKNSTKSVQVAGQRSEGQRQSQADAVDVGADLYADGERTEVMIPLEEKNA